MNKKNYLILAAIVEIVLAGLLLSSCQEEEFAPGLTKVFTIQSDYTGGTYEITVGLPSTYSDTAEKFSAIYVLDSEQIFDLVANECQSISVTNGVQNALVIGIGWGRDRSIDYTPTKLSEVTGGGLEFMQFIESELIPRIEREFNVDTTPAGRVILGHSYGGLFGACVFAVNNDLFGNYLLLSPSIWFDNEVSMILEKNSRAINKDKDRLVFMGIGEAENAGRMQAPFEAFYQTLRDNYSNLRLFKNSEKNLDHVGSRKPNVIKSLNFYFQNR
jgi:predicted alpha/beta superfamily hydrolase